MFFFLLGLSIIININDLLFWSPLFCFLSARCLVFCKSDMGMNLQSLQPWGTFFGFSLIVTVLPLRYWSFNAYLQLDHQYFFLVFSALNLVFPFPYLWIVCIVKSCLYIVIITILFGWNSIKGRLILLSLETIESPRESGSFTAASNLNSSHAGSPFPEFVGYAAEELSSNSMCSSPDEVCCNQIQPELMAGHLRSLVQHTFNGAVLAVHPYLDRYVLAAAGNVVWLEVNFYHIW